MLNTHRLLGDAGGRGVGYWILDIYQRPGCRMGGDLGNLSVTANIYFSTRDCLIIAAIESNTRTVSV